MLSSLSYVEEEVWSEGSSCRAGVDLLSFLPYVFRCSFEVGPIIALVFL